MVLLSLALWEGPPRTLANKCKCLRVVEIRWGISLGLARTLLWCSGLSLVSPVLCESIGISHIQKPVAGKRLKTFYGVLCYCRQ